MSSILVFVGLKLCNPKEFLKAYKVSNDHFIVFLTTAIVTVAVDMLVGVAAGIVLKTIINFVRGRELKKLFKVKLKVETTERQSVIYLDKVAVFTNWLPVKEVIQNEKGKRVIVDFTEVYMTDSCFIENVMRMKDHNPDEMIIRGFRELRPLKDHPYSMRIRTQGDEIITIQLKRGQVELKNFCEENGYIVSFNASTPKNYFNSFKSFKHADLKQTEVFVSGKIGGIKFEYLEGLMYDSVDMLEFRINGISIELAGKHVPKFRMQRESKLDTVIEFLLKNQVVFENHPRFNTIYSIYSREKAAVNELFTDDLISFFETNDLGDIIIEGNGENRIIMYNNKSEHTVKSFQFMLNSCSEFTSGRAAEVKVQ